LIQQRRRCELIKYSREIKPFEDETLTSYVLRLSEHFLISPKNLRKELGLYYITQKGAHCFKDLEWPYKIDFSTASEALSLPLEKIIKMTLCQYTIPGMETYFNIPHRRKLNFWFEHDTTKFCPECLKAAGYWRHQWKSRFYNYCEKHQRALLRYCPQCGGEVYTTKPSISTNRVIKGHQNHFAVYCQHCGYDLRDAHSASRDITSMPLAHEILFSKMKSLNDHSKGLLALPPKDFFINYKYMHLLVFDIEKYDAFSSSPLIFEENYEETIRKSHPADAERSNIVTLNAMANWPKTLKNPCEEISITKLIYLNGKKKEEYKKIFSLRK